MKLLFIVSADQNTYEQIVVNKMITDHGKRSFEGSSNWTVTELSCRT